MKSYKSNLKQVKKLGEIKKNIENTSYEYETLAKKDEEVAILLKEKGQYRHAMYFFLQSMEKYIRSKIFTIVNPNIQYFRDKNKHHSLEKAIEFLLEVCTTSEIIKKQVREQLIHSLGNIDYQRLHNSLRYPFYSSKEKSYSSINYSLEDCYYIQNCLESLKLYLKDLDMLIQ